MSSAASRLFLTEGGGWRGGGDVFSDFCICRAFVLPFFVRALCVIDECRMLMVMPLSDTDLRAVLKVRTHTPCDPSCLWFFGFFSGTEVDT